MVMAITCRVTNKIVDVGIYHGQAFLVTDVIENYDTYLELRRKLKENFLGVRISDDYGLSRVEMKDGIARRVKLDGDGDFLITAEEIPEPVSVQAVFTKVVRYLDGLQKTRATAKYTSLIEILEEVSSIDNQIEEMERTRGQLITKRQELNRALVEFNLNLIN